MILYLSLVAVFVIVYLIFHKYVELFEYKHCLRCPLKEKDVENVLDVFIEDIKKSKECEK